MKKFLKSFYFAARVYSLPMSIINVFAAFAIAKNDGGNVIFGLLVFAGVIFAHIGVNLFDTAVDYILKVPKQPCKTEYLDAINANSYKILASALVFFGTAGLIGLFFATKFGLPIVITALIAGAACLAYPRLNFYTLGELAVFSAFGPLLYFGTFVAMTGKTSAIPALISISPGLLTAAVLIVHSHLDCKFDEISGKKTLNVILKGGKNSVNLIKTVVFSAFAVDLILISTKILPLKSVLVFAAIIPVKRLFELLRTPEKSNFPQIFSAAQNIFALHTAILGLSLLI